METRTRASRSAGRLRRRVKVTFLGGTSFTSDIGRGGFSTERARVPVPGAPVEGFIDVAGAELRFRGRIAWARAGDLTLGLRGRMGVQFADGLPGIDLLLGVGRPRGTGPSGQTC